MDRLAAHIVATAVLTAALAAVPTAMANPASDSTSTPKPSTSASASAPSSSEPTSDRTRTRPIPCADARQVGKTSYAYWHGIIAFSIKQFYSPECHADYGYAYPWLQFRVQKQPYDLGMAVFDLTHDAIVGARTFVNGTGGPDFWSAPFIPTAGTCTQGLAHVFFPDTESDTFTDKFCV